MEKRQTEIIQVDALRPAQRSIDYAATLLRAGELVIFPTETVYGLGADALQPQAVKKIFAAKERPFNDPLIVHIADEEALLSLVSQVPEVVRALAAAFWPGPLTLIMPASAHVPGLVTSGLPNVAVRMPDHPVALALIRATGSPIAAPSANRFMHVSPTTAQHALNDLGGRVPLILDGGTCRVGVESTVLDLCSEPPRLLRPGGIGLEDLRRIVPEIEFVRRGQLTEAHAVDEIAPASLAAPGQMLIHYAPSVPTFLFEGSVEAMRAAMQAEVRRLQGEGKRVGVLVADEDVVAFEGNEASIYALGNTPEEMATRLFAGLRTLEDAGVQVILCRSFEEIGLGRAIMDRLLKASGGNVYRV